MKTFDINTWEIFIREFSFWKSPAESSWPMYSYESARVVENLVIQHFMSNLPVKMNHSADYETFIRTSAFSIFNEQAADNSPVQFGDDEQKFSDEEKNIVKLFSRLTCWTKDFLVSKEQSGSDFFEVMFALSLRQCDITDVYNFLEYQMSTNFQNDRNEFVRYLKPLTNKYRSILFYDDLSETIYNWIELQEVELFQSLPLSSKPKTLMSFQLQNKRDQENLINVLDGLKKNQLVAASTSLPNFKKIFRGEQIIEPVIWTGNISELKYFVKLLHTIKKKIKPLSTEIWKVTAECFVPEGGGKYDWKSFNGLKTPAKAALLETIVEGF